VRAIEQALERMDHARKHGGMPLDADREFHLRIAEASGNSALALVVKTLWDQRTGPLFLRLEHHFDTPDLWSHAIREHRDIVEAIARRDASGARSAMRRHMDQSGKRFSASWGAENPAPGTSRARTRR
jgi:DNA-binding FadR family transcriptional regulator